MNIRAICLILAIVAGLLLMAGCGQEGDKVLAEIGDHKITQQEFDESFPVWMFRFTSAQDEFDSKRGHLDSLITTWLLIDAAYEVGLDQSEELARVVVANEDKFLLDALYQKHVLSKIEPTESEVRDFYNHMEFRIRAAHILVDNLDTAQMLMDRLEQGENFEKLAFDYSTDPSAQRNKGDLGYFTWGAMVEEFQQTAFALEPGEVSTPVKTQFGFHIIKLIDRVPNAQRPDFESTKAELKAQVRQQKKIKRGKSYIEQLKSKYIIRIDTVTCRYLMNKREQMYPPMVLETLPRNDFDTEALDRDEKELILANWEGGQLTLMEYLMQARETPVDQRPDFDNYDGLAEFVFALKSRDILIIEAHRESIDTSPEFLRKLKLFRELNMADLMRTDSIPKPEPPDDEAIRRYYDEHPDEFTTPAKVHVYEILLSDELQAQKLKDEIRSLAAFKEKATELTERPGRRTTKGDMEYIEEAWFPEIFKAAWETPIGAIGGPVASFSKHSIFYVVDRLDAQLKDYLGQKRPIYEKLAAEREDATLLQWLEERRKVTPVKVYDDRLWEMIDEKAYAGLDTTQN